MKKGATISIAMMGQVSRERPIAIQVEGSDAISTTIYSRRNPFKQGIVGAREGDSPPGFRNGLGTMYMASFRERTFIDLTTKDWVWSLGTLLGRC